MSPSPSFPHISVWYSLSPFPAQREKAPVQVLRLYYIHVSYVDILLSASCDFKSSANCFRVFIEAARIPRPLGDEWPHMNCAPGGARLANKVFPVPRLIPRRGNPREPLAGIGRGKFYYILRAFARSASVRNCLRKRTLWGNLQILVFR